MLTESAQSADIGQVMTTRLEQLHHLGNLIRARLTLEQNIEDSTASHDHGFQPIYLVDANVLHLFFDPANNTGLVQLFPGGTQPRQISVDTAIITGQFLFSGRLPGQRLLPLFIDPGHLHEFRSKMSAHLNRLNAAVAEDQDDDPKEFKRMVAAIKRQLTKGNDDPSALRRAAESQIPQLIERFNLGQSSAALQLLKLSSGDRIRPLRLAPNCARDLVDHPEPEIVARWQELLLRAHHSANSFIHHDAPPKTKNQKRDAECLARIEALNTRNAIERSPARFVLITTDELIHTAVAQADDTTGGSFVEVRRASQYIPVFNTEDMDNQIDSAEIKRPAKSDAAFAATERPFGGPG